MTGISPSCGRVIPRNKSVWYQPTPNSGLPGLRLVAYVNYRFSYHTIIALLFVPRFLLFVFTFERHRRPSVFDSSDRRTGTSYDCLSALMPHARIQS
ncbi:hypothetical protein M378DRAFT_561345 [Amanita muscaria Koide BX008]|uniref:Uncharacterized protein n=1 Tax=Amanita muscaria (strain Koide BX008) TaxID=946122 RepID=A0A0C2RZM9_AMAMK|nr:hypothetical protein M378DRAFT_561345 [Amanita muscaria Koide BX008]